MAVLSTTSFSTRVAGVSGPLCRAPAEVIRHATSLDPQAVPPAERGVTAADRELSGCTSRGNIASQAAQKPLLTPWPHSLENSECYQVPVPRSTCGAGVFASYQLIERPRSIPAEREQPRRSASTLPEDSRCLWSTTLSTYDQRAAGGPVSGARRASSASGSPHHGRCSVSERWPSAPKAPPRTRAMSVVG